ncbi:MAG: glycosyltransferase WbuB [Spirosoma sp.]|nr:glycosyltransferase WbuB [Spirosoma sp.]
MKILYMTFYFEPDLCAGSFRNTPLVAELARQLGDNGSIHVVTTHPNRYQSFRQTAPDREVRGNVLIDRIAVPAHASGLTDQIRSFITYYRAAHRLVKDASYDVVVASSSRLFTAFLGARLARKNGTRLFLDIRDLFRETILEMLSNRSGFGLLMRTGLKPVLWAVEKYTFGYATHINLVSEGFRPYFSRFSQATYSYFTNGIDNEFLPLHPLNQSHDEKSVKTILYAGNIGEGQGLHKIIPQAARALGDTYRFVVIGDGGARQKLDAAIREEGVTTVELRPPVSRSALVDAYEQADYLFVHLNDLDAFKRVLPSKLFEYGATDKPIMAGVAGYAAQFVREHLPNTLLFAPGDVSALVEQLRTTPYRTLARTQFRAQFQRQTIMEAMARQICHSALGSAAFVDRPELDRTIL